VLGASTYSAAGVKIGCGTGKPVYQAVSTLAGTAGAVSVSVKPGDSVTVTVTVSASSTSVTVNDTTAKTSKTVTGSGFSPTGASVGIFSVTVSGVLQGVPNVGTVTFTGAKINGQALGSTGAIEYQRYNGSTLQIANAPLTSSTSFETTYQHA
jgi:uncharacterized protein YqfA (UPF0365 family)